MSIPMRESLCVATLVSLVYQQFRKIPDPRKISKDASILFIDVLMSGLAVFGLKFPSLLKYDQNRNIIEENLKTLYHVNNAPSDTYLRERLDELDPKHLRTAFTKIFAKIQRSKCLERFEFFNGAYLLSIDGTGAFSSGKVCCPQCCKKEHKDGSITYYHQMLAACVVHPENSNVIPLCPEIIQNEDGSEKNDCERNAAKRFLEHLKREHPHLKVIVIGDGIASNAPYIQILAKNHLQYILGAKPGDHKFLFDAIDSSEEAVYHEVLDDTGVLHQFRYINDIALNKSNPDVMVNFFEYMQTDAKGKESIFSWVTNIHITKDNIFLLMKGGRARWKIENETFNTLKNMGYNFEHNYGHGKKNLSTILCLLMMIAFLIDQVQGISCSLFQAVKKRAGSCRGVWENMKVLFQFLQIPSWEWFYQFMAKRELVNTS